MSKRAKFVLVGIILGVLLWLGSLTSVDYRFGIVLAISSVAYVLSVWVLFDDLKGVEWLTLLVLPVMFTLGSGLFGNFLPAAIPSMFGKTIQFETSLLLAGIFKVIYYLSFVVGIYGILLVENIFSVASIRTIQLFRAARSANFVFTLITSLFFYTVALSLRMPFWSVTIITFIVTFLLSYENLWSVDLKNASYKDIYKYAFASSWIVAGIAFVLCFWPVKPFMGGLMLTSAIYALLGVLEQRLSNRVYLDGLLEYGVSSLIIIIIGFLTTSWLG
jgi:hypothetical protein